MITPLVSDVTRSEAPVSSTTLVLSASIVGAVKSSITCALAKSPLVSELLNATLPIASSIFAKNSTSPSAKSEISTGSISRIDWTNPPVGLMAEETSTPDVTSSTFRYA